MGLAMEGSLAILKKFNGESDDLGTSMGDERGN